MLEIPEVIQYVPCPESDKLIIYFSSASARHLEGVRQLEKYDNVNKLFIRDPHRNWYNGKIGGLCTDADSLAAGIRSLTDRFKKENIVCIGSSMGGYGAILFGCLLEVGLVYAVAPQIVIHPNLPHSPKFLAKYSDLSAVLKRKKPGTVVHIWFGCGELLDTYQVLRCSGIENCTLYPVPQSLHNVLAYFKSKQLHEIFLESLVLDKPFTYAYGDAQGIPYPSICKAMDATYFEKNYKKSNTILCKVAHPLIDGALHYQIGLNFKNNGNNKEAVTYLEKAISYNSENYDAYFALGGIAVADKNYEKATEYYTLALKYFPGKNIDYVTQLAAAYRLNKDFDNALQTIDRALSMNIEYPKTYYHAGLIYRDMCNYQEAIQHFQRTIQLLPDFLSAQEQLKYAIAQYYVRDAKEKFHADLKVDVSLHVTNGGQID